MSGNTEVTVPAPFCPRSDMTRDDDATPMTGSTHTCFMHQHARWWTPASSTAQHQQNTFISTDLQVENYFLLASNRSQPSTHSSQVSTTTPSSQVSTIDTRQSSLKIQTSMELGARWQLVQTKRISHLCKTFYSASGITAL